MTKGLLIVVSAPSGCGKGTILNEILKDESYYFSVSATTRAPRPGEIDGINYHFLTKDEFEKTIAKDGMLEYAKYCNNYYGTPKQSVYEMLEQGKNVVLEIEVQGAMQVMKTCREAVFIFICPPSISELERRLNKRGTESPEVIAKRVSEAEYELSFANKYNYNVVNDDLVDAVDDFKAIIRAEQLKVKKI